MAERKPLVRVGGKSKQLPVGDKIPVDALPVGTTAGTVAAGDDPRLSDARTPTAHSHDESYAPISKGVTNGDAHDHSGGDGGQIAYSSLSGLPTLGTAAPLNVAASGNAAAGEVVKGNDARLSDSREWTATKVTQAEAEGGTGTTDRKWDALRVRQAIAAWWLTASSAFGRTLANVADAAAGRTALGLGTAATATVTTGTNDTTAGRVTRVGDYGWGGEPLTLYGSWNDLTGQSRLIKGDLSTTTDGPLNEAYWLFGSYIRLEAGHAYFYGITMAGQNSRVFLRVMSGGTWRAWVEMPRAGFDAQFPSIKFPAAQVPSSDPNTLDDYEEGVFTPAAFGTVEQGSGTYTTQQGKYTKIGNAVFFSLQIDWTAHTGTGNIQITGLPFISPSNHYFTVAPSNLTYTGQIACNVNLGTSNLQILSFASNSAISPVAMDSAAGLRIAGHYFV